MSAIWNDGYLTDSTYTYGYYPATNPVFQRFCLLINGICAAEPQGGIHCELGFGQGVSINYHAAAIPGQFWGTDFNPAHAAHANILKSASGSSAKLFDDSFEQFMNRTDMPQFDSISLHGIWSWVSRKNQQIITEFARKYLKPGGVFYNSYNCFPGWAPAHPLRQLFALHDRFSATQHSTTERVGKALKFAEEILAAKPSYLEAAPTLEDQLKEISTDDINYVAHEYFNREWSCMYFTDVVDALTAAKLDFACSANPWDTVTDANFTEKDKELLKAIDHPLLREQVKDYFINRKFRKDLFVRGAMKLLPKQQEDLLLDTRFVLHKAPEKVPLKFQGKTGKVSMKEEFYRPLLETLASNSYSPKKLRHLAIENSGLSFACLKQIITILVGTGDVSPCQNESSEKQVRPHCQALNDHLCQKAELSKDIQTLVSPVTGGGIAVGRFQKMFLLSLKQGKREPQEWAQSAWQSLKAQGQRLIKEGQTLNTDEENMAQLTAKAQEFESAHLPILKALQIA